MWQNIIAFMRDQAWSFVAIPITIILTVWVYKAQRNRTKLTYEVISRQAILSAEEEHEGKLQVLYDGEEVKDVRIIVLKLRNSGNTSIKPSDHIDCIKIKTGENSKILSVDVPSVEPEGLRAEIKISEARDHIRLEPLLLNPKDSITIKLVVSNLKKTKITCRIAGVQSIQQLDAFSGQYVYFALSFIFMIVGMIVLASHSPSLVPTSTGEWVGIGLIALGYIPFLIGMKRIGFPGKYFQLKFRTKD